MLKDLSPFDVGILQGSISSFPSYRGFTYIQDLDKAKHGLFLDNGSAPFKGHIGWWTVKGFNAIQKYTVDAFNGIQDNYSMMYQSVAKRSVSTPAKQQAFIDIVSR
jgi:hypothetical protein